MDRGIMVCGGSSQLPGIEHVLRKTTGLPILRAEHPTHAVALGGTRLLEDMSLFRRVTDAE